MHKVRLEGKTAIVTGANTGIGLETARELADRGARVILACRNRERGEAACEEIRESTGSDHVQLRLLNLSSFTSITTFAEDINKHIDHVHLLVNNAGVFTREKQVTEDGFEVTFGVNHLGPFLLTYLLLDKLKTSAPARIVNVASIAYEFRGKINFEDLQNENYNSLGAYGKSKCANMLHALHLAKLLQGTGVTTYSLHPGAVQTDLGRECDCACFTGLMKCLTCLSCQKYLSPQEGARTTLYCCLEPSIAEHSGRYYYKCRQKTARSYARDGDIAEQLWDVSMKLCRLP